MLQHGIYTINENGQGKNFIASNAGSLLAAAKILNTVEQLKKKLPKGSKTSLIEALDKYYNFVALKGKSFNLFHALDEKEFEEVIQKIKANECQDSYIDVDFDTGSLGFLCNNNGKAFQITLPISDVIDAYSSSLHKKNSSQSYVNANQFSKQIEKISGAQYELSPQDETDCEPSQSQNMNL